MKIFATPRYIRMLKKFLAMHPEYHAIITRRLELLEQSPNHPTLRLHKLANRENEYSISIDHSIRLIFSREKSICYLLEIGSHDEVY